MKNESEKKLNKCEKAKLKLGSICNVAHVNSTIIYSRWRTQLHKAIWANYVINYSSVLDQIEGKLELYTLDRGEAWLALIIECLVSQ